ncbi:TetR/AcrR family transcriptional regulator [Haliangium ochraceum]|uniref:Transcriptional regulator, TetR family n=1 Tax=Haliangium ochraceum (strain DSM 14365 / JCM 11303 / SMP-2) TaxID=502025 RepID=D0LY33_HALO1|nr:TetR/AcrR family transcriptional regulator [Haliangium ochraceum]ACY14388.1 transcriptional regulator, TetR family [Haliangium ochraceum DSM 14365]
MVPIGTKLQGFDGTDDDRRTRLIEAFAAAISEDGYAATTIADIVRRARVSKRTFYEHFSDKQACLLATYAQVTSHTRACMRAAFDSHREADWRERLEAVLDAYVTALESSPALTRACLTEMAAAGPRALELRREVHGEFAALLREVVERTRARHPEVREISPPMATALVGGIDELLLAQLERGPQHRLANLRETAAELLRAVLLRPPTPARDA